VEFLLGRLDGIWLNQVGITDCTDEVVNPAVPSLVNRLDAQSQVRQRTLFRTPYVTAIAIVSLALGIPLECVLNSVDWS